MILAIILAIIVAFLLIFVIGVISAAGAIGIIIFADVIVCIAIIIWLIRKIIHH